jgi:hypothetical protein
MAGVCCVTVTDSDMHGGVGTAPAPESGGPDGLSLVGKPGLSGQAQVGRIVWHATQCPAAHPRDAARAARVPALVVRARLRVGVFRAMAGAGGSVLERGSGRPSVRASVGACEWLPVGKDDVHACS